MSKNWLRNLALVAVVLAMGSAPALAQDLVKQAMGTFPLDTQRLEYSNTSKLRTLPDYATLHERYLGPSLRKLESQLATLGVRESDIDEIVLGWRASGGMLAMGGLASGRIDPQQMARQAAASGVAATPIGSASAYCFGSADNSMCVAALGRSFGAFGPLDMMKAMLDVRQGQAPAVNSSPSFSDLVARGRKDTPIWGVAEGSAIEDAFKGWMPVQKNLPIDLATVFSSVQSLDYSVNPTDRVHLSVEMTCTSAQAAANIHQGFDELRLFQKVAWRQQYPNTPNPFDDLTVSVNGQAVLLSLSTPYSALEVRTTQ
ncbi:MAG TPA: hypothetical protein VGZ29_05250 [Terriglobia bacterium]|nr:hypothetical protein [Terriglobia bacterium]